MWQIIPKVQQLKTEANICYLVYRLYRWKSRSSPAREEGGLTQSLLWGCTKNELGKSFQDDSVTWLWGSLLVWASPEACLLHGSWPPPQHMIQKTAWHEPQYLYDLGSKSTNHSFCSILSYTGQPCCGSRPQKNFNTWPWKSLEP